MRVNILGPLEVVVDGRPAELGGARLRVLLARLALTPGRMVSTEALADALWSGAPPADQLNALQSVVSRLRRILPADAVKLVPGGYRLDLPPEAVDAEVFERLAREGRASLRGGDPQRAAGLLTQALALWRGPALADTPFAESAVVRLDELRLAATEDRIEAELACGRTADVAELEELIAAQPLRERLADLLMRALAASGRAAEALAAYERTRRRLADDLGADPGPELRATHLALLRGDLAARPEVRARGNLRAALTSFVGRADDLERIGRMLRDGRLVTLVGPGGAGKTRLAATVAAGAAHGPDWRPASIWLVELAPVGEADELALAVLRGLDLRERVQGSRVAQVEAPRDPVTRLADFLDEGPALLILDNCEHIVDAAARLADELLARCPDLRILATSREPLGILGETLCPIAPLRPPAPGLTAAQALAYPSVQLLRDRAAAVRPGFAVTDENIAAIIEIVRRLDGLPLAIELAAARLRSLPPEAVASRLDDRFRLLTGGSRTAMPRHRTLRAVVAWSWELLTEDERHLADRLAVFPGTITHDSAAGIAGRRPEDLDDLLAALVDKSLLQPIEETGPLTAARYRMLETIREYASERLADEGTAEPVRARFTAYYLALTGELEPLLRQAGQLRAIDLTAAEEPNILAALQYACETGDAATALTIAANLSFYWNVMGRRADATEWLERALDTPGEAPADVRAVCFAMHIVHLAFGGDFSQMGRARELAVIMSGVDVTTSHPLAALIQPIISLFTDATEAGLAAIELGLGHPDPWVRAVLISMRGSIEENEGDADGMLRDMTHAVELLREQGERWGLSMSLTALADAYGKRGRVDEAIEALEESVRLAAELNSDESTDHQLVWLTALRAKRGEVAEARAVLLDLARNTPTSRNGREAAFALLTLAEIDRQAGEHASALEYYDQAQARLQDAIMVGPQLHALMQSGRAYVAIHQGRLDEARDEIREAMKFALDGKDMPVAAHVAVATAALRLAQGDPAAAAELIGASEALRGTADQSNADAREVIAGATVALGPDAYAAAYARGRRRGRQDALALADPV
ncbi:BTAD domain-containing putative transcriptional regulator [Hamadaea tsunoensis]|uniref:BTAD domain-containing putative transcriptional regulator n=1 Tax=Hamadaea tsunoensis TaxID=53368 RepID=UPI0003FCE744|nr:BTAD domain-containing putative transcriptional regulator [Hamadaea tsunoensis]